LGFSSSFFFFRFRARSFLHSSATEGIYTHETFFIARRIQLQLPQEPMITPPHHPRSSKTSL
jgi:hypothetical protein